MDAYLINTRLQGTPFATRIFKHLTIGNMTFQIRPSLTKANLVAISRAIWLMNLSKNLRVNAVDIFIENIVNSLIQSITISPMS